MNNTDIISKLYMENNINSKMYSKLAETIREYYKTNAECVYKIDTASSSEVVYNSTSRKVSDFHDNA